MFLKMNILKNWLNVWVLKIPLEAEMSSFLWVVDLIRVCVFQTPARRHRKLLCWRCVCSSILHWSGPPHIQSSNHRRPGARPLRPHHPEALLQPHADQAGLESWGARRRSPGLISSPSSCQTVPAAAADAAWDACLQLRRRDWPDGRGESRSADKQTCSEILLNRK